MLITGYSELQLLDCVYALIDYLKNPEIKVLYDKYALPAYGNISIAMFDFLKYKGLV